MRSKRAWSRGAALIAALAGVALAPAARAQEIRCDPESPERPAADREACRLALEGLEAFRQGHYRVAGHRFQEANDASPGFEPARTQFWFGRALLGIGKTREAAFTLYRALRVEAARPDRDPALLSAVRLWLGKTYDLLGRRGAALDWYRQVVDSGGPPADVEEARRYAAQPFDEDPAPLPLEVRRLRQVLRQVHAAEEAHWRAYNRYSDRWDELDLAPPAEARVELELLDEGGGYIASGRAADGRYSCRVFAGRGTKPGERGIVFCF